MKTETTEQTDTKRGSLNRDPITGAPGAHPVGTGLGAAGGGATGAAIGSVAGPIGTVIGGVAGAIAGGLAGKGIAEAVDPTVEDAYWRNNYSKQDYVQDGEAYDAYAPAYRTGYEGRSRYPGKTYEEAEADLQREYQKSQSDGTLDWNRAKYATRDAWDRIGKTRPTDPADARQ